MFELKVGKWVKVLEFSVDIMVSPEEVFNVIGDPCSKLKWVPAVQDVNIQADDAPGPGCRYTALAGVAGLKFFFHEEIVQWEPPTRLAYQGESPWGCFLTKWVIEPTRGGSQAHFQMDYRFPGGCLGYMLGGLAAAVFGQRVGKRTAIALKETIEKREWSSVHK